jgi:hypothetical protein
MSRPPTREAAVCRTLKPFQPSRTMLKFCAACAAARSTAAPSGRVSAPGPTMIAGASAPRSWSVKARPAAMLSSDRGPAPTCSTS